MSRSRWLNLLLATAIVALFALPLALRLNVDDAPEGEAYPGSDSTAAGIVQELDPAYSPWAAPWFEPSSGEIESGLFALQAALGAGALGFTVGRLSGRRTLGTAVDSSTGPGASP